MSHVVVERSFPRPQSDADLSIVEDRLAPCSEMYGVIWKRSVVSLDRRHMICEYDAPDAETVRKVQREAGAAFDHIWSGEVIGS
ncbi:nickel-binding protein [Paraburkholderia sp. DGU8]|uniref:nickel-binding protein n=1 Tax=Paraburkholderia sp. DGU8 TaxID=3161997 RepID=UPI003465427A